MSAAQLKGEAHQLLGQEATLEELEWQDGPTLTEIAQLLGAHCPVIISQENYFGVAFATVPSGSRPVTLTANRRLSPLAVATVAARYWAVHAGPLEVDDKVRTQCAEIAETSAASFPVPDSIAHAVLSDPRARFSTSSDLIAEAFRAIALIGYDALWAAAFSSLS